MKKERVIFHMDGDAFFVWCEIAKNPKLLGLPVVTGEERGIVSALSYEAKALGIVRGMPIFQVKKNFPKVIILPGDYKTYADFSLKMFNIVRRYADVVEEYSIDECFADLTGLDKPLYMSYEEIGRKIKNEIQKELNLSVSVGIAPSKGLAKLASKWQKPNGFTMIKKENRFEFLNNTSIGKVWGIGRQTSRFLIDRNILTAGDFAGKDFEWIRENLSKPYQIIWHELNGDSISPVDGEQKDDYKSVQKTRTFHPKTNDRIFLISQLSKHVEEACRKCRYYGLVAKRIHFFLKTEHFRYHSFGDLLTVPTISPELILRFIENNFSKVWQKDILYRSSGVVLAELCPKEIKQMDLFGYCQKADRFEVIHRQIDSLEDKFGKKVVYLASTHKANKKETLGTDSDDLERDLLFL